MNVRRLAWLGTRTAAVAETAAFFRDTLGIPLVYEEPGFAMLQLPGADYDFVEVFGADDPDAAFYTTGPVVGLLVDDIASARGELESAGIELLGPMVWAQDDPILSETMGGQGADGYGWFHFRGPDGNVYCCVQGSTATA
jgi:catechol 2,3-dioxygenase-like lactoylglutathione lyase family enzyme